MTINWGIIGTGAIANIFASEFDYVDNGKVLAVASRTDKKAELFARKYEIKRSYSSYEALVNDRDIDIIYIATPHNLHYENTMLCLENNKSVLCEKPMAPNKIQVEKMFKKAEEENLFLMEAMWTYFLPAIKKVQKWIKEGKIGDVQIITAQVGIIPKPTKNEKKRLFNPELAGGALLDTGIYPVALANLLLPGDPVDMKITTNFTKKGVDEHNAIILKYKNGTIAQLTCTIQAQIKTDAYIYGSKGKIHIPSFLRANKAILEYDQNRETFKDLRSSLGYNYEIEAVNSYLNNNEIHSNVMPPEKTLKNIKILDNLRNKIGLKYPFE